MNWFLIAIIMVGYTPTINVKAIAFDSHQQCTEYMSRNGQELINQLTQIYPNHNNINVGCVDEFTLKNLNNDNNNIHT